MEAKPDTKPTDLQPSRPVDKNILAKKDSVVDRLIGIYSGVDKRELRGKTTTISYTVVGFRERDYSSQGPVLPNESLGVILDALSFNDQAVQQDLGRFLYEATKIPIQDRTYQRLSELRKQFPPPVKIHSVQGDILLNELAMDGDQKYHVVVLPHSSIPSLLYAKSKETDKPKKSLWAWIEFIRDCQTDYSKIASVDIDEQLYLITLGAAMLMRGVDGLLTRSLIQKLDPEGQLLTGPHLGVWLADNIEKFEEIAGIRDQIHQVFLGKEQILGERWSQLRMGAYLASLTDEDRMALLYRPRLTAALGIIRIYAQIKEEPRGGSIYSLPLSRQETAGWNYGLDLILEGIKREAEKNSDVDVVNELNMPVGNSLLVGGPK